MLICFNGVDGSGKTTQANLLVERLNAAGYRAVYLWCGSRSSLSRPLTTFVKRRLRRGLEGEAHARLARDGAEPATGSPYIRKTRRLLGHPVVRTLWLLFTLAEHTLKIWWLVLPRLLRGEIVVCDRYLFDSALTVALLSGLDASALPGMLRVARWFPVPRPGRWFFLDLSPEQSIERKPALEDAHLLRKRVALYRAAARLLGMEIVDASRSENEVTVEIAESMRPHLLKHA